MSYFSISNVASFYRAGSIFQLLDTPPTKSEEIKYFFPKRTEVLERGVRQAVKGSIKKISLLWLIQGLGAPVSLLPPFSHPSTPLSRPPFFWFVVARPLAEELIFRGGLQTTLAKVQIAARQFFSPTTQSKPWFQWLTSRAARIVGANTCFALTHLFYQPLSGLSIAQFALTCLYPTYSLLYETTGDLRFPIGARIASQGAAWAWESLEAVNGFMSFRDNPIFR